MFIISVNIALNLLYQRYIIWIAIVLKRRLLNFTFRLENTFNKTYLVFLSNQEIEHGAVSNLSYPRKLHQNEENGTR